MSSVNRSGEPQVGPKRKKEKGTAHFWRACRFLYPYRWLVMISILCAVFVSSATTVGLTTILPVMRVMVRGDTIGTWANRTISQNRLGFTLADEGSGLIVLKVTPGGPAAQAGLKPQDVLDPGGVTDQEKLAASAPLFRQLS